MKNVPILLISGLLVAALACHRDGSQRSQQQYETVQEGQAAGVTSTIHGPGETVPPMTGTNADTTSAFTINPALATGPATPPGTLSGALPNQPYGGTVSPGYVPPPMTSAAPPAQQPREQPTYIPAPRPGATTTAQAPPPTTTQQTDTAVPPPPPPATETAPPTQTQTEPPPSEKPKESKGEKPPESTDTQQTETTPPPPPPM